MPAGVQERAGGRRPGRPPAAPESGALSNLSGRGEQAKLAASIASRIVDDVVARGWPVGEVLGSADELLERFDISRAVFREAVRLLEHQQVARTRRGPGGGLIVAEPSVEAILDAAVLYLHRVDARLDEVVEAGVLLQDIVADVAAARVDEAGRDQLEAVLAAARDGASDGPSFHAVLARLTANPALELFVDILDRVSLLYRRGQGPIEPEGTPAATRAHRRITDAVGAGDRDLARRRMREHLDVVLSDLDRVRTTRRALAPDSALSAAPGHKRAELVARSIYHGVVAGGLEPGHLLGSEPDLMERHGVSRAVFREAVRLLEHHHIAAMRRGPGGGLFVAAPSSSAVADVVAIYLARHGTGVEALGELRGRLEVALVDLVVDRLDPEGVAALDDALEVGEDDERGDLSIHNLHANIARLAGNRVLELLALVLIRLTRFHQYRALEPGEAVAIRDEVNRVHVGIARAIQARDKELARKRVARHLDALTTHLH